MLSMAARTTKIKFLAMFVLAFLCLNAGGTVCLAYCQGFGQTTAAKDHCPLQKAGSDCEGSKNHAKSSSGQQALDLRSLECCTLSISFVPAPVEKHAFLVQTSALVAETFKLSSVFDPSPEIPGYILDLGYREPVYDLRGERIRHHVFRI
jgi:hypothetical protein